jgi:hypothetical protein
VFSTNTADFTHDLQYGANLSITEEGYYSTRFAVESQAKANAQLLQCQTKEDFIEEMLNKLQKS